MILLIFILFIVAFYFYATKNHDYWTKRNIKHDAPIPLFGNNLRNQLGMKNVSEIAAEMYYRYPNEKVVGYFNARTPVLIIRDLDIVRRILNVDFANFYPRGVANGKGLMVNLFHADGDKWRLLRQRLTPAFTTAKLRNMFPLVVQCAEKLQGLGGEIAARGGECDVRDLMARFTIEFIGACGFGIEMNTINNQNSIFRDLGNEIVNRPLWNIIKSGLYDLFPELRPHLNVTNHKINNIITEFVKKIREKRNNKPCGRNDFIDLLLELEQKGKITGESIERQNPDGTPITVEMEMDLQCMVAQVFVFFAAGFETSSSATSFTLHELAFHPEIQTKIQEEIDEVLLKYDNKLCYDAIAEMRLLDMAFKEAMRIFPSLGVLNRLCARRYTISELGITIDPGVKILIPIQAIHMDKQYFENPREFRLDRFTSGAVRDRQKFSYLPFGGGPRACIGERLGQMQSLAGLAAVLHQFSVEPAATTSRWVEAQVDHTQNTVQSLKRGLPLRLTLRAKTVKV